MKQFLPYYQFFVWHRGDIENVAIVEIFSTFLGVRNRPKVWVPFIYLFFLLLQKKIPD